MSRKSLAAALAVVATCQLAAARAHAQGQEVFVLLREPPSARLHSAAVRRHIIAKQQLAVLRSLRRSGVRPRQRLHMISAFTATASPSAIARLRAEPEVMAVTALRYGSGGLDRSVPQIRADAVHRRDNRGQTVTVAVLDTGVQATHPDLAGSVVAEHCFCSGACCPNGASEQSGSGSAFTTFVHGMHVSGIIASQGHVAPLGVAPRVKIVSVKVLNDENRGSLFDWLRGLEWILHERADVQEINMSLVSDELFAGFCDDADAFNMGFAQMLSQLRARGTLAFVSSGNTGDLDQMTSPACIRDAVAVGAVDRQDHIAEFTSRSVALDLLAPGTDIVSDDVNDGTATLSGTSMAAPHATGSAALLLAWHPALSPDDIEAILKARGRPVHDQRTALVVPRIDALAAFTAVLPASQPLLGGGSGKTDCLLEWTSNTAAQVRVSPRLRFHCRDGDPACDGGAVSGQCSLSLSLCFNNHDARLPHCQTAMQLDNYELFEPRPDAADAFDSMNANAIMAALPAFPLQAMNVCTNPVTLRVPVGRPKRLKLRVNGADGRSDVDSVVLECSP